MKINSNSVSKKVINIFSPFYFPEVNGMSFVVQKNVEAALALNYDVNVFTFNGATSISTERVFTFDISGNGSLMSPIKGEIDIFLHTAILLSKAECINILHGWHSAFTNTILDNLDLMKGKTFVYSHGTGFSTNENIGRRLIRKFNYWGHRQKLINYMGKVAGMIFLTDKINHRRCFDNNYYTKLNRFTLFNPIPERKVDHDWTLYHSNPFGNLFNTPGRVAFCLSNYEKVKNQEYLILLAIKYGFKLICIGSEPTNYYRYLVKLVSERDFNNQIKLLYKQDDNIIVSAYKQSDFFLFASRNDFSPLVLIESAKYQTPFLSFETADTDRPGGFFCKDKKEYEAKIKYLLNLKKPELMQLGMMGLLYYEKFHSTDKYTSKLKLFLTNN